MALDADRNAANAAAGVSEWLHQHNLPIGSRVPAEHTHLSSELENSAVNGRVLGMREANNESFPVTCVK